MTKKRPREIQEVFHPEESSMRQNRSGFPEVEQMEASSKDARREPADRHRRETVNKGGDKEHPRPQLNEEEGELA